MTLKGIGAVILGLILAIAAPAQADDCEDSFEGPPESEETREGDVDSGVSDSKVENTPALPQEGRGERESRSPTDCSDGGSCP